MIGAEGGSQTRTTLRSTDFKSARGRLTSFYYALPSRLYRRFSRQSRLCPAWYEHVSPSSWYTYDFASDENPNKNRAREMMRMMGDINVHLKKIEPSGDQRVNIGCNTCHRGRPRPMTLEEERYYEKSLKFDPKNEGAKENLKKNQGSYGKVNHFSRFSRALTSSHTSASAPMSRTPKLTETM
jgi:hypothetical protein